MSNLIEIQNQIEKLQKQAMEIRSRDFHKTVQEIRSKMRAFGITLEDLKLSKGRDKTVKTSKVRSRITKANSVAKKTAVVAAKYRGPNGEVWSGRGLTPRWLAALLAQGRKKEEFAINTA